MKFVTVTLDRGGDCALAIYCPDVSLNAIGVIDVDDELAQHTRESIRNELAHIISKPVNDQRLMRLKELARVTVALMKEPQRPPIEVLAEYFKLTREEWVVLNNFFDREWDRR